jgi:hypothetical protein
MAKWGEVKCPRRAELEGKLQPIAETAKPWELKRLGSQTGRRPLERATDTRERKYALRIIVKYLKGEQDAVDTPTDPDERRGS